MLNNTFVIRNLGPSYMFDNVLNEFDWISYLSNIKVEMSESTLSGLLLRQYNSFSIEKELQPISKEYVIFIDSHIISCEKLQKSLLFNSCEFVLL